jgi:hypothetical protein
VPASFPAPPTRRDCNPFPLPHEEKLNPLKYITDVMGRARPVDPFGAAVLPAGDGEIRRATAKLCRRRVSFHNAS